MGLRAMERSIRVIAWVWRESISIADAAECGLVLLWVEGKLFIIWSRYSTTCCKWIYGADISFAEVSSIVDSGGAGTSVLSQDN